MLKRLFIINVVMLMLVSCSGKRASTNFESSSVELKYAKGLKIEKGEDFTVVSIVNPWDTTTILQKYILVDSLTDKTSLPKGTVVNVPIKNVAIYTSVHVSIIEMLGKRDDISGVCEIQYIDSDTIQDRVARGIVADLGDSFAPNIEKIIDSGTEIVISSPFKDMGYAGVDKLGIPIIESADYMENHPLGRAEWIKFYGLLTCKEGLANEIFASTEQEYLGLKDSVQKYLSVNNLKKSTLLVEKNYGAHWFIPHGESCMGVIYKDAGCDYIFDYLKGTGSTPFAFEEVLDKAIHADYWLIKYNSVDDMTYTSLRESFPLYAQFDAFKNKCIYGCNTGKKPFYEESPMNPQYLLKDMISIFYPNIFPDYQQRYFDPLKD